jgi:hypothetical protein
MDLSSTFSIFEEGIASSAHVIREFKDARRPPGAAVDAWERSTRRAREFSHIRSIRRCLKTPSIEEMISTAEDQVSGWAVWLEEARRAYVLGLLRISSHQAPLDQFNEEQVAHDHRCQEEKV